MDDAGGAGFSEAGAVRIAEQRQHRQHSTDSTVRRLSVGLIHAQVMDLEPIAAANMEMEPPLPSGAERFSWGGGQGVGMRPCLLHGMDSVASRRSALALCPYCFIALATCCLVGLVAVVIALFPVTSPGF